MPPLAALRAFSAFAERKNLADAGAELNVSHAAISQQLRNLESHLGVALVDRNGRALMLTDEGDRLAKALELGFGAIDSAVSELMQTDANRPVHVSITPSFAAEWLLPRLSEFRDKHPDVDLIIDPSPALVQLTPGGIDIALRYGDGNWSGLQTEPLFQSPMVIVAAPSLLKGREIQSAADLVDLPWIEEFGTTEAGNWLRKRGVEEGQIRRSIQMPGNMKMTAAREGQGVFVAIRDFVEQDLASGQLVEIFRENEGLGYHIVTRPGVQRPPVRDFVRWLRRHRQL